MEAGLFAAAIDMSRPGSQLRVLPPHSKAAKLAATHCRLVFKTFLSSPMGVFGLFFFSVCVCACLYVRMRHDFNIAIGFGREKVEHNVKRCPKKQLEFHTFRFETGLTRRPFWSRSRSRKVWHGMTHCQRFALDGSGNLCIYRCHGLAVALCWRSNWGEDAKKAHITLSVLYFETWLTVTWFDAMSWLATCLGC